MDTYRPTIAHRRFGELGTYLGIVGVLALLAWGMGII